MIVLDAVSELFDLYSPTVLQWLPLLLAKSVLIITLNSQVPFREFIDYTTSIITDEDPLRGLLFY